MLRIKGFAFENLFDIFEKRYKKPVSSKGKLFFDHARFHKCTDLLLLPTSMPATKNPIKLQFYR